MNNIIFINIPTECPCCGHPTVVKESEAGVRNLYCTNPQCSGKLVERLEHFCSKKGLEIRGLSEQTLEKLVDWEWVKSIKDIFNLSAFARTWKNKPGFGEKSVDNILTAIEVSKHTSLEKFISGLGIPLIGERVAKDIAKKCDYDWDVFRTFVYKDTFSFEEWAGFGYEMNKALKNFDYSEADELAEILDMTCDVAPVSADTLSGKTFVITGKLSRKRDLIIADVEFAGGKVQSSVSSKTQYLVCNQPEATAKYKKAQELNIPIITEEELMELLCP